ncbi:MAG: hypothetical protein RLZZ301_282 [Bacteroidota bacterium]|jgi:hypothetical protein
MSTIEFALEPLLVQLDQLSSSTTAQWGSMSAQRMIEHLSDSLRMSIGIGEFKLEVPEDRLERMQAWLETDKDMAKDMQVSFATPETPLRNDEIATAIDEFTDCFLAFEEFYEAHPDAKNLHPYYGQLDYRQWCLLHTKHFKHHLAQFNLL